MFAKGNVRSWPLLSHLYDMVFAFREGSSAGFRQVFSRGDRRRARPRRRSVNLAVEGLERRWLMATINLAAANPVDEGVDFVVSVILNATAGDTYPISVDYHTVDGSGSGAATAGEDYDASSGTVSWSSDTGDQSVSVPTILDNDYENDERFSVVFTNPVNVALADSIVTAIIHSTVTLPVASFSGPHFTGTEPAPTGDGPSSATITVTLDRPSDVALTVDYTTSDLCGCGASPAAQAVLPTIDPGALATANPGATAGTDYVTTSGQLTFPSDDSTGGVEQPQSFTVPLLNDKTADGSEDFLVLLTGGTASLNPKGQWAIVTIKDNPANGVTYVYDGSGYLTEEIFPGPETITFDPDPSRTNELGQTTNFTYNGAGLLSTKTDPLNRTTTYLYNADGMVTSVTGPAGPDVVSPPVTQYLYDANDRLTEVINPDSYVGLEYTYDANGNMLTETDGDGNTTSFTYDASNDRVTQTDPLGNTTTYTYNDLGQQIAVTNPLGQTTSYAYDSNWDVTSVTDPLGHITTSTYTTDGQLATVTDPLGHTTTYTYLDDGRLSTMAQPNPSGSGAPLVTTYTYDDTDHTTTVTDPLGHVTTSTYNARGWLITQTNALGAVTTNSYDAAGELIAVTDPLGHTTSYGYDADGEQITVTDPLGHTVTTVYNELGQVAATIDPRGNITSFAYDADGRQTGVEDALGNWTETAYDGAGNVIATTDANGNQTDYRYDALNRVTVTIDPLGEATTTLYDAAGEVTATIDPRGNETEYLYDAAGRQTVTIDALGGRTTTLYDAAGNVTETIDPRGNTTQTEYDALNRATVTIDALGDRTTTLYDAVGDVTATIDPRGNETEYLYDAAGQQTVTIDALGGRTTTLYDAAGDVTGVYDPRDNLTQYEYDAAGRQTVTIDPLGDRTTTLYDAAGNVTGVYDPRDNLTQYEYDAVNQLTVTIDALGGITTTLYDAAGNVTGVDDANGNLTQYYYDQLNRQDMEINARGGYGYTYYDAAGNVTETVDALDNETQYLYDALNRQTETIDALSNATTMLYDAAGNVTSVTDANGNTTQYEYDALNRLTVTIDALSGRTTTLYDAAGKVTSVTDANSDTTEYEYDALGRPTVTIDALSGRTTTLYDAAGNVTSVTDPAGNTTQYEYDALNRQTVTIDGLSERTTTVYDAAGNITAVTDVSDAQTQYEYDALNRQTVTIDALGDVTTTVYDAVGNVTSITDAENGYNNVTTFQYDALNDKIKETDPLGNVTTYAYNTAGLLTQTTDALGQQIDTFYDADNRVTGQTWYDASDTLVNTLTFTYDGNGNLLTAADANSAYTLSYDALNRVTGVQEPFGQTLTFAYDAVGNRTGVQDSQGGLQTSLYDALDRLTSQQFSGVGTTQLREDLTYTADGQVATLARYSNLAGTSKVGSTTYSYDADNRITSIQQRSGVGTLLENTTYTYDDAGRVQTQQLNGGATVTYTFDALGELLSDGTNTYTYDGTGNRTSGSYSPGPDNQLTTDGTWTYTYDADGNLVEKSQGPDAETWTYGYDNMNRLTVAKLWSAPPEDSGSVMEEVDYTYDVFGNRIEESVSVVGPDTTTVTKFAYDGWKTQDGSIQATVGTENWDVWADLTSSNTLQTRYLRGDAVDQIFARVASDSTAAWYLTDKLGSVVNLTDASGTIQDTITYDGWGNFTESNPSFGDRYKWTGREYDTATGLQYNRARYYDPATGRWMSQDPLGFDAGDSNLYRYVGNKPAAAADPSGLQATQALGAWGVRLIPQSVAGLTDLRASYSFKSIITYPKRPQGSTKAWILSKGSNRSLQSDGTFGTDQPIDYTGDFVSVGANPDTSALNGFFFYKKAGGITIKTAADFAILSRTVTKWYGYDDGKTKKTGSNVSLTMAQYDQLLNNMREPIGTFTYTYLYINTRNLKKVLGPLASSPAISSVASALSPLLFGGKLSTFLKQCDDYVLESLVLPGAKYTRITKLKKQ